jgi:hypothetical protein
MMGKPISKRRLSNSRFAVSLPKKWMMMAMVMMVMAMVMMLIWILGRPLSQSLTEIDRWIFDKSMDI